MEVENKNTYLTIVVISLILVLIVWDYNDRKNKSLKQIEICSGKIYDTEIDSDLNEYYLFKYFFKNKIYKELEPVEYADKKLIGKCFEVNFDPNNPSNSHLNLTKELNCEIRLTR